MIMRAALLFKVAMNSYVASPIILAGTIAGNLLSIFAVGSLGGLLGFFALVGLMLPFLVLVVSLLVLGEVPVILRVFIGNVLALYNLSKSGRILRESFTRVPMDWRC